MMNAIHADDERDPAAAPAPYRVKRLKVLKALCSLTRTQPILLYQLVILTRYPSWTGVGMAFLGLIANHLAVNIVIVSKVLRSRRRMITGYLDKMRGFTFQLYPMSSFLEPSVHADISNWYTSRMLRMFRMHVPLESLVKIYVVTGAALVEQLSSYWDPLLFHSYIFLPDPPEETHGVRRFFVLHEIGHTQMALATQTAGMYLSMWPYACFIAWVVLTCSWSAGTLASGAMYLCSVLVLSDEWKRELTDVRASSETIADSFALGYLSKDELARVARNQKLAVLLDRDMNELQNTTRLARLRENIELMMRGEEDAVLERTFSTVPEPTWKSLLAMGGLVAVVGLYGAPPTIRMLAWIVVLAGVLLVWWLLLIVMSQLNERAIEERLSGSAPAGQTSTRIPALLDA